MQTKEELEEAIKDTIKGYKEIIFGSDTPTFMACLDELQIQQVIDQKVYDQKLMEDTMRKLAWEGLQRNIVMDGDTMIDKRTVRYWILKLIPHIGKTNFKPMLIVFIDHKITWGAVGRRSYIFYMALAPWIPEVFAIFRKKSSLPSFLPCSNNSSHCYFVISFTLALAWFLISAWSIRYFSTSCSPL